MTIRTRFAPSPTGYLHIGGARTALFCYLFAKHNQGQFLLRIEDTDRERSTDISIKAIFDGLNWLGLTPDQEPVYQTNRTDRYQEIIKHLLDNNLAYYCYCTKEELETLRNQQLAAKQKPKYDGRYRNFDGTPPAGIDPVIRFKNPLAGSVKFDDLVRGNIVVNNEELDDVIIARSDGTPTYNFAVVVDDMDMDITHVIRGDDHINNTPRQINIYEALNVNVPKFAHVPMILGEDGARLSKRHGAVNVMEYREQGILPQALLNYLVRLGWSHGDQEIFSLQEMIEYFDIGHVNKAAAAFNFQKLLWLNEHYLKLPEKSEVIKELTWHLNKYTVNLSEGPSLPTLIEIQSQRVNTIKEMAASSICYFIDDIEYDEVSANKQLTKISSNYLLEAYEQLKQLSDWDLGGLNQCVKQIMEKLNIGMGKIAQPLRVALTGNTISPSIDATLLLMGKEKTLIRIKKAIDYISAQVNHD